VLIGFDKVYHFLPGFVLSNVIVHAHLAAIGWAAMMIVGIAYRLLPMILPAAMPNRPALWISAVLLETGVVRVFCGVVAAQYARPAGCARCDRWICGVHVAGRLDAAPSASAPARPTPPDPAVLHAGASFASLGIASVLGMWLVIAEPSSTTLRIAIAYGVFGVLGFLAQIVVGMEGRLLPIFVWYWAYANSGSKGPVPSQHEMPWRAGQEVGFVLCLVRVPTLAVSLAFDGAPFVSAGGWCLLAATILDTVNTWSILLHAFLTPRTLSAAGS
jgi:hypothetical protein